MKKIPDYALKNSRTYTSRKFKSLKRKQLRMAIKALSDLQGGCAYFPNSSTDVDAARKALELIKDDVSIKNWGN